MAPVLYTQDLSPPSRSVLLAAAALGVDLERRTIDLLKKDQLSPEYRKVNVVNMFWNYYSNYFNR